MKKELISIIVPVHNAEPYLEQCLDSILNQTYREIEVLLAENGSMDNSLSICSTYQKKDSRVKVLHVNKTGPSSARNEALDHASGRWLLFVDSDDYIETDTCEHLMKFTDEYSTDLVVFGMVKKYARKSVPQSLRLKSGRLGRSKTMSLLADDSFGNYAWNKFFKRELFEDVRFPEGSLFEDVGTIYKVVDRTTSIGFLNRYMYYYRQHENSIMHKRSVKRFRDGFEQLYRRQLFFHKKYPDAARGSEEAVYRAAAAYILYGDKTDDPSLYHTAYQMLMKKERMPKNSRLRTIIVHRLLKNNRKAFLLLRKAARIML